MEIAKTEVVAVTQVADQANQDALNELNDVQLALVGGGIAVVVFG